MIDRSLSRLIVPLTFVAALLALALLLARSSETPEVLGRWSLRYTYLLALVATGTLALGAFSVPAWRARLLRRSEQPASRRQAWALLAGGLLLLPVASLVLQALLPVQESSLMRALLILTLCGLTLPVLWLMHRSGAGYLPLQLRRPGLLLILLVGLQLLQVTMWIGLAPEVHRAGDLIVLNSGVRQAADISSFIMSPERNSDTWFNFFMLWPLSGVYMRIFGVGVNQARFFYLLVSALALPFITLSARRLFGKTAAFAAIALGLAIPLQYNWILAHSWVASATSIALYAMLRARDARRPAFYSFLCGFAAVSAVEGHIYGAAFALMFCLLWLWRWLCALRQGESWRDTAFWSFVAGFALFSLLWAGYHIALPGTSLADVPERLRETWAWESSISNAAAQVGLTPSNILAQLKIYFYSAPAEMLLLTIALAAALKRRSAADGMLLFLSGGALLIVGLLLGHVNDYYLIFLFPFVCLWFGAWLGEFFNSAGNPPPGSVRLSVAAFYVLLAALFLYASFGHARAQETALRRNQAQILEMERIGREIEGILPAADIVVAGDPGYYLGMPQRLNYGVNFSFTWDLPAYWAFDDPQAIIVTLGVDESYSDLDRWLIDHNFQPARCFAVPGVGDGVAILYLLPELMPEEVAIDCTPDDMAWLQGT